MASGAKQARHCPPVQGHNTLSTLQPCRKAVRRLHNGPEQADSGIFNPERGSGEHSVRHKSRDKYLARGLSKGLHSMIQMMTEHLDIDEVARLRLVYNYLPWASSWIMTASMNW